MSKRDPMPPIRHLVARSKRFFKQMLGRDLWIRPQVRVPTVFLGSEYGGYAIDDRGLNPDSIVYSFGLGEDVSFDLAMIERYQTTVHAFDPTPRAIAWLREQSLPGKFVFRPVGLADHDGAALFAPPSRERHVSYSLARSTPESSTGVVAQVARLATLLGENGHDRCDVLKMDVEGAEYQILEDILDTETNVRQIVLEFHPEMIASGLKRTSNLLQRMNHAGYSIIAISPDGRNYSLRRAYQ
ncbi:MAG: FkbM family methyltransferase [Magnetococcales bacterium]|nr:FkbM family methyltransferase [Magnetococcales bacterium]